MIQVLLILESVSLGENAAVTVAEQVDFIETQSGTDRFQARFPPSPSMCKLTFRNRPRPKDYDLSRNSL